MKEETLPRQGKRRGALMGCPGWAPILPAKDGSEKADSQANADREIAPGNSQDRGAERVEARATGKV